MSITLLTMRSQRVQLSPWEFQDIQETPPTHFEGYSTKFSAPKAELSLLEQIRNDSLCAKVIFFGSDSKSLFSFLSNDYSSPLEFGEMNYRCATSAYESQKFMRKYEIQQRFTNLNAKEAYALSAEKHLMKDVDWYDKRTAVMKNVLRAKFGQNPYLKELLLATADTYLSFLASHKNMDTFWTNDRDGSGANELGQILMDIRWEYGGSGRKAPPENYKSSALSHCSSPHPTPCLDKTDAEILSEIDELNHKINDAEYISNSQIARRMENQQFTRFPFCNFPYDKTLVPLSSGRFINANFVLNKQFIGTQSPMLKTMEDFWTMVLEHHVPVVVMLNRLGDPGDDIYFPFSLEDSKCYGGIKLKLAEPPLFTTDPSWRQSPHEEEMHAVIHRKVIIEHQAIEHCVDHFQYQNWRDFSAGNERAAAYLIKVVNAIRKKNNGPTVIHCHAGVGRTAVAIALFSEAEHLESGNVDLMRNVERQRSSAEGRCHSMMQARDQYHFCYRTLREYAQGRSG